MGEQMPQRDRVLRRPQLRLALLVETLEHLRRLEFGEQRAHWLLELQLALLDELHGGGRRDRLGHRRDPEHRVECHVGALGEVALAERALVQDPILRHRRCDHAGDVPAFRRLAQNRIKVALRRRPCAFTCRDGARRADPAERSGRRDRGCLPQYVTPTLRFCTHGFLPGPAIRKTARSESD
jgi:hypothetical protein